MLREGQGGDKILQYLKVNDSSQKIKFGMNHIFPFKITVCAKIGIELGFLI
jgi:hypothetical protein